MLPINIKPGQQDFDHVMLSVRLLTIIAGFAFAGSASAASIGIVAPQNGPYELLGQQVRQGAKAAAAKLALCISNIYQLVMEMGINCAFLFAALCEAQ